MAPPRKVEPPAPPADPPAPPPSDPPPAPEGETVTMTKAEVQKMIDDAVAAKGPAPREVDREARYSRADLEDFAAGKVAEAQAALGPPPAPPAAPTTPVVESPPRKKGGLARLLFGDDPNEK